jgi:hypothetical protein
MSLSGYHVLLAGALGAAVEKRLGGGFCHRAKAALGKMPGSATELSGSDLFGWFIPR